MTQDTSVNAHKAHTKHGSGFQGLESSAAASLLCTKSLALTVEFTTFDACRHSRSRNGFVSRAQKLRGTKQHRHLHWECTHTIGFEVRLPIMLKRSSYSLASPHSEPL